MVFPIAKKMGARSVGDYSLSKGRSPAERAPTDCIGNTPALGIRTERR
jgi:hypothetical protein